MVAVMIAENKNSLMTVSRQIIFLIVLHKYKPICIM